MGQYTSYYLYQKYEERGEQEPIPCYPNVYSIDGEGTMPLVVKSSADTECGAEGTIEDWFAVSTYCVGVSKYEKQEKAISYDDGDTWVYTGEYRDELVEPYSVECGYVPPPPQYRTISGDTYCSGATGYDKYVDLYYQVSYDGGISWHTTSSASTLVEAYSEDCGYEPIYSWNVVGDMCGECDEQTNVVIHDNSGNTYTISGSGEITRSEVSGYANVAYDIVIKNYCTSIGENAFSGFSGVYFARIPSTVQTIGERAFIGCSAMTECQVPSGTTSIGASAFTDCISLCYADIPTSVLSIGEDTFKNCLNFRYVSIPTSITSIPNNCFYNCDALSDIELHSGITSIGDSAFGNCNGLYSVTVFASTPPTLGNNVFDNYNIKIYVPSGSVNTYKTASGWSNYSNNIYAIS